VVVVVCKRKSETFDIVSECEFWGFVQVLEEFCQFGDSTWNRHEL